MVSDINKLGLDVKWQDLTPGCTIVGSCTAEVFRTGEWRVDTPEFIEENVNIVFYAYLSARTVPFL